MRVLVVVAALVLHLAAAGGALAQSLPKPGGPVILEARGKIANTNGPGVARFDLAMLRSLTLVTVRTWTPWTEGVVTFEGVDGKALLEAVGASGQTMHARAINDYHVEVPLSDLRERGAFFALSADGKRLTARDKGPVWLLYPFDSDAELKSPNVFNRSIWQLAVVEFR